MEGCVFAGCRERAVSTLNAKRCVFATFREASKTGRPLRKKPVDNPGSGSGNSDSRIRRGHDCGNQLYLRAGSFYNLIAAGSHDPPAAAARGRGIMISPRPEGGISKTRVQVTVQVRECQWVRKIRVTVPPPPNIIRKLEPIQMGVGCTLILRTQIPRTRALDIPPWGDILRSGISCDQITLPCEHSLQAADSEPFASLKLPTRLAFTQCNRS